MRDGYYAISATGVKIQGWMKGQISPWFAPIFNAIIFSARSQNNAKIAL